MVADVHGDFDAFEAALALAPPEALVLSLGDLVDRGPYAPLCVERLLELMAAGQAVFVPGNHDVALLEVVEGRRAATPRRAETLAQFDEFGGDTLDRFCAAIRDAALCLRVGDDAFVHAAWSPAMETRERWEDDLRRLALYGEQIKRPGVSRRETVYRWVDRVPAGRRVFVGHDVRGEATPLVAPSAKGGAVTFLDLGCGKGGALGCALIADGETRYFSVESRFVAASAAGDAA